MARILRVFSFSIIFLLEGLGLGAQSYRGFDIDSVALVMNKALKGYKIEGVVARGVKSSGRTLIFEYSVPSDWYPYENGKQEIIKQLKSTRSGELYAQNDVDVLYRYYKGSELVHSVKITSIDLGGKGYSIGNYVDLKGHPKAKGVNVKLKKPVGWRTEEGLRPNIVKKFTAGDGKMFLIQINNSPSYVSKSLGAEIVEETSPEEILEGFEGIMTDVQLIESSNVTIDNYPAKFLRFSGVQERAGLSFPMQWNYWVCYYEDAIVFLQGAYTDLKRNKKLEALFGLVVNSVIFPDQYN